VSTAGFMPETNNGTMSKTGPHADSRAMVFDASGNILEADDGGFYKRTSPINANGDWSSIAGAGPTNALQLAEMHDLAYDSISKILFGGDQDTGTPVQNATNGLPWTDMRLGDGGDVAVDTISSAPNSLRYLSSAGLSGFRQLTFDPTNTQVGPAVIPTFTLGPGSPAFTAQFYSPVRVNKIDTKRILFGFNEDVYESLNKNCTVIPCVVQLSAVDLAAGVPAAGVAVNDFLGHFAMVYGGVSGGVINVALARIKSSGFKARPS